MSWYFFFFAATRAFNCLSLLYYANTLTLIKIGTAAPARSAGQANKARSSGLGTVIHDEPSLMTLGIIVAVLARNRYYWKTV